MIARIRALALSTMLLASTVFAQDISMGETLNERLYVAAITLHTTAELHTVLQRADQLLAEGVALQSDPATVTFILHGPEAISLLRKNYLQKQGNGRSRCALVRIGGGRDQSLQDLDGGAQCGQGRFATFCRHGDLWPR